MGNNSYDWFRFWVHFIFGAIVGAGIGGITWMSHWHPGMSPFVWIICCAAAVALAGGVYGDRFWEWFVRNLRWW